MDGYLVTVDRGVVTVFPPLVAFEHAGAVEQRFEEFLRRYARRYAGTPWHFSRRDPLCLVGAGARRLSAGQRIFLAVVRLCAVQRPAVWRELVFDGSVLEVLDEEHREAVRQIERLHVSEGDTL